MSFGYDHGLVSGQTIVLSNTTNFDTTYSVATVLSDRLVWLTPEVAEVDEGSATVTYDTVHNFSVDDIISMDKVELDIDSIRNKCTVHYNRVSSNTFTITAIDDTGTGGRVQITCSTPIRGAIQTESPITVDGCSTAAWNTDYGVYSIDSDYQFTTDRIIAGAPAVNGYVLADTYKVALSVNTASILSTGSAKHSSPKPARA